MSKSQLGKRKPKVGERVNVVQKQHYSTGRLTTGTVKDVLTNSKYHPRGHKVRLENGVIGRVQSFVDEVGEQGWKDSDQPAGRQDLPGDYDLR